jgi:hypothetical protein
MAESFPENMALIYQKKFLKFITLRYGLTYFDEPYCKVRADVIREWQYSKKRLFSEEFHTLFIDLTKDEEAIFDEFEKTTKYQINRAKSRDNIHTLTLNEKEQKNEFYAFYNAFAASKKLPPVGEDEINLLIDNNMFKIRAAFMNDGGGIVYHSYVIANKRARLMQSASLFRDYPDSAFKNFIGRANRFLHWDDICYFRKNGCLIYDLGGVGMNTNDKETQAINEFKEGFGGTLVREYKSQVPLTVKGFFFLLGKKLLGKL